LDCAQAQQAAAEEQLKLASLHNQQLQQQAVDACRGALAGDPGMSSRSQALLSVSITAEQQ
jgi:hypothetical protein